MGFAVARTRENPQVYVSWMKTVSGIDCNDIGTGLQHRLYFINGGSDMWRNPHNRA